MTGKAIVDFVPGLGKKSLHSPLVDKSSAREGHHLAWNA